MSFEKSSKKLHGKLPSRENVTELLQRVVVKSPLNTNTLPSVAGTDRVTDHRMSSQKRLLFDEYGINFPTKKTKRQQTGDSLSTATSTRTSTESSSASSCTSTFFSLSSAHCTQETQDFKLALKLQQEEIDESPSEQQEHTAHQVVKMTAN